MKRRGLTGKSRRRVEKMAPKFYSVSAAFATDTATAIATAGAVGRHSGKNATAGVNA
jgi:hypothetical protein